MQERRTAASPGRTAATKVTVGRQLWAVLDSPSRGVILDAVPPPMGANSPTRLLANRAALIAVGGYPAPRHGLRICRAATFTSIVTLIGYQRPHERAEAPQICCSGWGRSRFRGRSHFSTEHSAGSTSREGGGQKSGKVRFLDPRPPKSEVFFLQKKNFKMGQILDLARGNALASGPRLKPGSAPDVSDRITVKSSSCALAQIEAGRGGIGAFWRGFFPDLRPASNLVQNCTENSLFRPSKNRCSQKNQQLMRNRQKSLLLFPLLN